MTLWQAIEAAGRNGAGSTVSGASDSVPGVSSPPLQSPALQRAARRERDRLLAETRRIERRLEGLEDERARLREEPARVLAERAGPGIPVHYAKWHDWMIEEGFVVLGKRPKSTFLTGAS